MERRVMVRGIGVGVDEDGPNVPAVVLEARGEFLPIIITSDQTQTIRLGLSGEQFEHPLTHDPPVEMVTEFRGAIDSICVDDLSNGTFLVKADAERYHDGEARSVVFDARLSDAIALITRADCPILISDEMLDAAGQSPEAFDADFGE